MYSTTAYLYQQRTRVLLLDTSAGSTFTYRWDPVYAKKLTINKGVDNVILFEFVNQDQKPVNITGSTFVFRAISQNGEKILLDEAMVILSAVTGRAKVTLTTEQLLAVQAQPASYSIARTQPGGLTEAVFVDAQAGARAPVDIVDSVLPEFVPSSELTIPTLEVSNQVSYDGAGYSNWPGGNPYWSGNPTGIQQQLVQYRIFQQLYRATRTCDHNSNDPDRLHWHGQGTGSRKLSKYLVQCNRKYYLF
jgi:BppU N-terminal domain